ncbi:MAG: hypothetical protein HN976_31160 [Lentisphaerae bacterium]|jgi:hypothetical protein|nr:hypothetical protein [Lentisphaerota bacterium]
MFTLPASLSAFKGRRLRDADILRHADEWAAAFAPILWLHPDESYFPEDCGNVLAISDLNRPGTKPTSLTSLDELGAETKETHFTLRHVDFDWFKVFGNRGIPGAGPAATSKLVGSLYSNATGGPRNTDNVFYAHLSRQRVQFKTPVPEAVPQKKRRAYAYLRRYNGEYLVIKYYFYFLYNDAWNKHIGDWDATIQLAIPYDVAAGSASSARRTLVSFSQHGTKWFTDRRAAFSSFDNWLAGWDRRRYRERPFSGDRDKHVNFGRALFTGSHVHGFVAQGSHAVYPTPGYSACTMRICQRSRASMTAPIYRSWRMSASGAVRACTRLGLRHRSPRTPTWPRYRGRNGPAM